MANSSSHIGTCNNCIIMVYYLSWYALVSTNVFRVFDFKVGLSDSC